MWRNTSNLTRTSDYLAQNLAELGFIILSKLNGAGLPLVAVRLDPAKGAKYDEFAIAHQLRERGWVVPAYTMAPHSESMKLMRVVVREDFSKSRCDALITDFKLAIESLDKMDESKLHMHRQHMAEQAISKWRKSSIVAGGPNEHFKEKDDHSLQGKHGKTHAVC
jgi:glutamate decarboxylase